MVTQQAFLRSKKGVKSLGHAAFRAFSVGEVVADSPLGMYILRVGGILFDLLAQSSDMDVYRADISRIFIAPDEVQKILSEMKADGKLGEISTEWFGSDITTVK